MDYVNGFFLFVDMDDVLIDSHNEMNDDLVRAYGKQYDWKNTVDCQQQFDEHAKILVANHGERAHRAIEGIKRIREEVQRNGMYYSDMDNCFKNVNSYAYDLNYSEDENGDFHYHLGNMGKFFVKKEKILDARDTKLFEDNHIEGGKHKVYYENYYTKERLLNNPLEKDKPDNFAKIVTSPLIDGATRILSHYNGPNEKRAKVDLCNQCYPDGIFEPLFFHENNTYNPLFRRPRYSKAKYVINELKLDIHRCILIDDSMENINAWIMAGGIPILFDPKNRYSDNNRFYVIRSLDYNEIMNVLNRIADRYERTSGKRLIKR